MEGKQSGILGDIFGQQQVNAPLSISRRALAFISFLLSGLFANVRNDSLFSQRLIFLFWLLQNRPK